MAKHGRMFSKAVTSQMAITKTARVLLFKQLSTCQNYWRTGRLDELLTMLMIEEMYVNCILEYKAGLFY